MLWHQAYVPGILAGQYTGLLHSYLQKPRNKKKVSINNEEKGAISNKVAFEAVYLELKLRFIESNNHGASSAERLPPPFKAEELIERSNITKEEEQWIGALLTARREHKNDDLDQKYTDSFYNFVRQIPAGFSTGPVHPSAAC